MLRMLAPGAALRHLALKSRDLAATERFYLDVLGFEAAFRHERMLFLRSPAGDDLLSFSETRARFHPNAGGFEHFGVSVPRAHWRAMLASLRRRVEIRGRRGRAAVFVEDPNGYSVELYRD